MLRTIVSFVRHDLFKNKVIFFLVIITLAVGSVAILTTSSILLGFRQMLVDGNEGWLGDIVITNKDERAPTILHAEQFVQTLTLLPQVSSVGLRSYGDSLVAYYGDKIVRPTRVLGINPDDERYTTLLAERVIEGEFLSPGDTEDVLIGVQFADVFIGGPFDGNRVHAGEEVRIAGRDGVFKRYRIKGIIDAKTFLPNLLLIFPKDDLENLTLIGRNSEIVVSLVSNASAPDVVHTIKKLNPDLNVRTAEEESGFIQDIVDTVNFVTGSIRNLLILSIFMIVNIVFYISISQKRRQIGIIKSMGATNVFVMSVYLLEAMTYALIAFSFGLVIYIGLYQYSLAHATPLLIGDFHLVINPIDIVFAALVVIVAAGAGTLIPSYLALRTKIIDVLRSSV